MERTRGHFFTVIPGRNADHFPSNSWDEVLANFSPGSSGTNCWPNYLSKSWNEMLANFHSNSWNVMMAIFSKNFRHDMLASFSLLFLGRNAGQFSPVLPRTNCLPIFHSSSWDEMLAMFNFLERTKCRQIFPSICGAPSRMLKAKNNRDLFS